MKTRIKYLDLLRVLAMFAIIMLHSSATNWYYADVHSLEWKAFNFYDSISRWGVPVFVMISGALFLNPDKQIDIKILYKKNIARLFRVFIFWSLIYAFYIPLAKLIIRDEAIPWLQCWINVFLGHYHMWFLLMIMGLYVITPLLRAISKSKVLTEYFLIIGLISTFVIPSVLSLLGVFDYYSGLGYSVKDYASRIWSDTNYYFTLGFVVYYVGGYYLSKNEMSKKTEMFIYILGIIGFASTVIISDVASLELNKPYGYYGNQTINVLLESLAVFTFVKNNKYMNILCEKMTPAIMFISRHSFGVYLVHAMVLETITKLFFTTRSFNAIISVPIMAISVFIVSLAIAIVMKKTPILKYFV